MIQAQNYKNLSKFHLKLQNAPKILNIRNFRRVLKKLIMNVEHQINQSKQNLFDFKSFCHY
jgi:hypothetical protein